MRTVFGKRHDFVSRNILFRKIVDQKADQK